MSGCNAANGGLTMNWFRAVTDTEEQAAAMFGRYQADKHLAENG